MNLREVGEFGLIARLKERLGADAGEGIVIGIGDDAAAIRQQPGDLTLLSTDMLLEGVHFDLTYFDFYRVGWRAAAANLSDIAAMGGIPQYLLVSIALPHETSLHSVEEIYRGALDLAGKHGTRIIGGDTTRSPGGLIVCVTAIGRTGEAVVRKRSAAEPGDRLFVTGAPGSAHAGMQILRSGKKPEPPNHAELAAKHLQPEPRVKEALFLVSNFPVHAMIDVSDGLASETHHLCRESGTGARVWPDRFVWAQEFATVADGRGESPEEYVLHGGEDFELLFTAPVSVEPDLQKELQLRFGTPCTCVGEIVEEKEGLGLVRPDGSVSEMGATGWDHFQQENFFPTKK